MKCIDLELAMAQQDRIQRLIFELLEAVSDGELEDHEVTSLLKGLAGLIPTGKLIEQGTELLVDALYRDAPELRQAAQNKRNRVKELRILLAEELEEEGGAVTRRVRRLRKKILDHMEDAQDLDKRADALEAAEEEGE